jgi:hypothetical protein
MNDAGKLVAGACLVVLALGGAAGAQDAAPPVATTFRQLNDTAVTIYQDAKRHFLQHADPVVIAGSGAIIIRHNGAEKRVGEIPAAYTLLKTIDHVPRSIWAALRPAVEGVDPDDSWRGKLAGLRSRTEAALELMSRTGLPASTAARGERTLRACLGLIDRYLAQGVPAKEDLQQAMRAFASALLADAADAAKARLDAIDRDLRPWWNGLSAAERDRAFVIVLGAKTARPGNLAYSYFVNLLGPAEDGHRVVYAEGVFDEKGADSILATLLTDRRLSVDFFADERRMERDLLADGAEARLLELFGRLGAP